MTTPTLRKPKALTDNHTDKTTREAKLYTTSQTLHVPSAVIEEVTGMTKSQLLQCLNGNGIVPLEAIGSVDRYLAATKVAQEFELLPTTDIAKAKNLLAICLTLNSQDEELENLRT